MNYEYKQHGDFPCKYMDLEALGKYPDIVLTIDTENRIDKYPNCIDIYINTPSITEKDALQHVAKALQINQNQLIFY
jgi:hypothetical protein